MTSLIRNRALAVCGSIFIAGGISAGCAEQAGEEEEVAFSSTEQAIEAVGDALPGISATAFAEAKAAFAAVEEIEDGVGPIFNERGCAICHSLGAVGGPGNQIERRFGRFDNGIFNELANRGGSLRQLFTVGPFTGLNGRACNPPLEVEPAEATVRNVGRLTTPLFGAGLIEAIPDSQIVANANAQPTSIRGVVNNVRVLLPNPRDAGQSVGSTRVGRFGWKGGIATLAQFAADAYINEMGITTQHCSKGTSVLTFANESRPNGVAVPVGCDDRAPPLGLAGIPAETDEAVGSCAGGRNELQDDVQFFTTFMTFLAPAPRLPIDPGVNLQGGTVFSRIGCAGCHLLRDYVTPSSPTNGVPGNFVFRPRSDFLLHDIGTGDNIGNNGDSAARTRLMRTAPLWGLHHRPRLLHDGRATTIEGAIAAHGGQAAASRTAFNALSTSDRNAMLAAMRSD
jgi:CxxC motif-containing protein (DUF1111 family)